MRQRINAKLVELESNPYSGTNIKMLKGLVNTYRLRVADYRIMYEIYKDDLVVLIIKTGTRNSFY